MGCKLLFLTLSSLLQEYLVLVVTKSEAPKEHCEKKSRVATNASQTTSAAPSRVHFYVEEKDPGRKRNKTVRKRGVSSPPLNYAERLKCRVCTGQATKTLSPLPNYAGRLTAGFAPARQQKKSPPAPPNSAKGLPTG